MNSACGQRVSVMMFCRWGVVGGVRFVCLALDVVGRLVVSPGLEARRTRLAPRPSEGGCSTVGEGAWTARSNASAAPLCGRAWCSGGVCKPGSRSGRATMDVIGRLVVSPGLEARRTRLAPRPSGGDGLGHRMGVLDYRGGGRSRPSNGGARPSGGRSRPSDGGCSTIGGKVSAIGERCSSIRYPRPHRFARSRSSAVENSCHTGPVSNQMTVTTPSIPNVPRRSAAC